MEGGSVLGRTSAARRRLAAPRALKTSSVGSAGVTLRWTAPKGAKPAYYIVLRDGKSLGKTTRTSFTDSKVKPGRTYRYSVRGYDASKRAGAPSSSVRVKVPNAPSNPLPSPTTNTVEPIATVTPDPPPATVSSATPTPTASPPPTASPTPTATPSPTPTPDPCDPGTPSPATMTNGRAFAPLAQPAPAVAPVVPDSMSEAMVDRLFWRAGFGPTQAQRDAWLGKTQAELVDWLLNTPSALDASMPAPKTQGGTQPIDPLASEVELELDWIDRMQRAVNPLPERLALFWHRHWAITTADGSVSDKWAHAYRNHLLQFSDFAASPQLTFRQLAYEMTTKNAAMSSFLNLNANTRTRPNENYAREFMELFCLGPTHPITGEPNYDQADIEGLTRAFTGWRLNGTEFLPDGTTPNPDYGKITFAPGQFYMPAKTILGRTIPAVTGANNPDWGPSAVNQATDIVLEREVHPQFLIRKLWGEFIASPIPQETLDALTAAYLGSTPKYQLRPVIRGILMSPLIFESLAEPNLVKPPIIYMVGVLRQLGAPLRHGGSSNLQSAMNDMQQRIYKPPNVAGWEGGMSWFNTNTVQGRFGMLSRAHYLRYSNYYTGGVAGVNYPPDIAGETAQAVFDRAYAAVNRPWISDATRNSLIAWAGTAATNNAAARRQRFYALQAMILGGPDGQVM